MLFKSILRIKKSLNTKAAKRQALGQGIGYQKYAMRQVTGAKKYRQSVMNAERPGMAGWGGHQRYIKDDMAL